MSSLKSIAIIGMPNVGKTALFNALTGSFQKVANLAGVTVEVKKSKLINAPEIEVLDLPGMYSLDVATIDEKVARDYILKRKDEGLQFLLVLDATMLEKSLYLFLQIKELGITPIVALNQIDRATSRGLVLDLKVMEEELGTKILPVSATTKEGLQALLDLINKAQPLKIPEVMSLNPRMKSTDYIQEKFNQIEKILSVIVKQKIKMDSLSDKIDKYVLHPFWGMLILAIVLLMMFQALFTWAEPFMNGIEWIFSQIGEGVSKNIEHPLLASFFKDGLIGGIGGVVVFLPQILLLFFFTEFLEDFGYLARAAFLMDGFLRKLGLPGKAMIPLLSSHACAIPGVMATRILENPWERLLTMMVIPLTTCSARLPVYFLLVAAIVPNQSLWGPITYQGLTMFGLYFLGVAAALISAVVMKQFLPKHSTSMLLMELPSYHLPSFKSLIRNMIFKAKIFLSKAGGIILLLSILIWATVTFPLNEKGESQIEHSYAAKIGTMISPILKPLGFDWRISTVLIPSFAAREVAVSALSTVFLVEANEENEETSLKRLSTLLQENYSLATLMSLLIWFAFAPQCISTIAIIKRESGGWKWTLVMIGFTLTLSYVSSFLVYRLFI